MKNYKIFLTLLIGIQLNVLQASQVVKNYAADFPALAEGFRLLTLEDSGEPLSFNEFMRDELAGFDEFAAIDFADEQEIYPEAFGSAIEIAEDIIADNMKEDFQRCLIAAIRDYDENIYQIQDPIFQYVMKYSVGIVGENGLMSSNAFLIPFVSEWVNELFDGAGIGLLHFAARNNAITATKILIDAKADVNIKDKNYWTPLHYVAQYNSAEVAPLLVAAGANTNAHTELDFTQNNIDNILRGCSDVPLHRAAQYDSEEVAQILIDSGADVTIKNSLKVTPLYTAIQNNAENVRQILLDAGAE